MYYPTPLTIRKAFDSQPDILYTETGRLSKKPDNINLSSIADAIIRDVGRFTERYAGDFLYNWKWVENLTSAHPVEPMEDSIIPFGIRRNGVDNTGFLMSRLNNECLDRFSNYLSIQKEYRRILAVRITVQFDPKITVWTPDNNADTQVTLKDLTDQLYRMEKQDIDWTYEAEGIRRVNQLQEYLDAHESSLAPDIINGIRRNMTFYEKGDVPAENFN